MRCNHSQHSLSFPVYCVGFTSEDRLVLGGGGGPGKSGIKNKLCLYKVDATTFELLNELELDPDEDAPMTMGVHTSTSDVVCGINSSKKKRRIGDNQNCRVFGTKDDQITKKQTTSTLKIEDEEVDDYQKVTAFSEENDILAVGSTNNEISLLSFPSLTPLADPFKIPKEGGDIFDLGFLGESVMVCGSKSIYFVSLPGDKKGSEKLLRATSTIGLPSLPSLSKGTTCSFRSSRISKPKDENEVTTLFAVVNTTPPRSARGGARSAYVCVYSQQGEANEWILGRTKSVSNKAITVFDINRSGNLLAYGSSDLSIGILDAKTLAPLLSILNAHEFPATALKFSPTSTLLVSGSADNNLIRHGKHAKATVTPAHAHATQQQQQPQQLPQRRNMPPEPPIAKAPPVIEPTAQQGRRQEAPQHIDMPPAQQMTQGVDGQAAAIQPPVVHTPYAWEAEMIVKEEREAKSRMPSYKGLERFRLVDKMGDGAFSNVYKATDLTSSQKVAVKVVRKYELNASQEGNKHLNPQFKKRPKVTERANILKEVQIMRGINHPSIVKLISFSESPEHYFLVLELMGGGELFHQIVKLTYFSEHLSRHVILQVAKGIRYLHEERGVVHRDIKPENILFERIPIIPSRNPVRRPYDDEKEDEGEFIEGVGGGGIGRVKIADFGLSKVIWDEQTMTPCGTVGYTAPEIVKDERYSKSVDMWALGCVLYTVLCGFPPFYDESIHVLTEKVARGYYTFLSPWWDDISASSKDLITHLLCVDPTQRYTIDEFLEHPWCKEPKGQIAAIPALRTPAQIPDNNALLATIPLREAGRSPGLATLKEAFDITYAVHRMEEEGARRRAYGAGQRGFLGGLNEEGEEDETEEVAKKHGPKAAEVVQRAAARVEEPSESLAGGRAGVRDQGRRKHRRGPDAPNEFELDLSNATLLGRRHRRVNEPSPLGPGLAGTIAYHQQQQQQIRRELTPMETD